MQSHTSVTLNLWDNSQDQYAVFVLCCILTFAHSSVSWEACIASVFTPGCRRLHRYTQRPISSRGQREGDREPGRFENKWRQELRGPSAMPHRVQSEEEKRNNTSLSVPRSFQMSLFLFVSPRSRVLSFSCVMPQPLPPMSSILVYYIIVKGKSQWEISAPPSSFFYDVYMSPFFSEFRPNLEYTLIRKNSPSCFLFMFYVLPSAGYLLQASRPLFSLQQGHVKHTRTQF